MVKGTVTEGTYVKFSADEKARVAKLTAEYGVFSTVRRFTKIVIGQIKVLQWINALYSASQLLVSMTNINAKASPFMIKTIVAI